MAKGNIFIGFDQERDAAILRSAFEKRVRVVDWHSTPLENARSGVGPELNIAQNDV